MTDFPVSTQVSDALALKLLSDFPGEAADRLESLEPSGAARALTGMPAAVVARMWEALAPGFASLVFPHLGDTMRKGLLEALDRSRAAHVLSLFDADEREEQFDLLEDGVARDLRQLLSYPEDTAGRLMDTRVFALHDNITVGRAFDMLRERGRGAILTVKVVDSANRLRGMIDLRDLAFADRDIPLSSMATGVSAVVGPMDPRSLVVEKFEEFGVQEIPVVDLDGHVLGVIRYRQLLGALRNDATLDIQTMVGASREERALSSS